MSYKVLSIPPFDKQLKRLAKKYPSVKKDFAAFLLSLEQKPKQGASLGHNCYKIRFTIESKGKGKSGGARVITYVKVIHSIVYLLSIYDKSDQATVTDKELRELLNLIPR
jgi:mRNA-degrading endonuclease RelE of RelBE toxin-antitoxin system